MRRVYLYEVFSDLFGVSEDTGKTIVYVIAALVAASIILPALIQSFSAQSGVKKKRTLVMGVSILTVAALLVGGGLFAWQYFTETVPLQKAEAALAAGDYPQAIQIYDDLKLFVDMRDAQTAYAVAAAASGDYDLAIQLYEDELFNRSAADEVRAMRIEALLERGDTQLATTHLTELPLNAPPANALIKQHNDLRSAVFSPGQKLLLHAADAPSYAENMIWYVAATDDGHALLVCANADQFYSLDETLRSIPHSDQICWNTSQIRQSLRDMCSEVFTEDERDAILTTHNENLLSDNGVIVPTEATDDQLFILSDEEIPLYLFSVADVLSHNSFLTRNPASGKGFTQLLAKISKIDNNTLRMDQYSLAANIDDHDVYPVMWIDVDAMVDAWNAPQE